MRDGELTLSRFTAAHWIHTQAYLSMSIRMRGGLHAATAVEAARPARGPGAAARLRHVVVVLAVFTTGHDG